jgi:hypothetical protein
VHFVKPHYPNISTAKEVVTLNEPTATLITTDVDCSSTNIKETSIEQGVEYTSNLLGTVLEANSFYNPQPRNHCSPSLPTPNTDPELDDQATGLSNYLGVEDINETWPDYMSAWYKE